jgi:long-chain acyl-CoA synthetase
MRTDISNTIWRRYSPSVTNHETVDSAIADHTCSSILQRTATALGSARAYGDPIDGPDVPWRWISWQGLLTQASDMAAALGALGVRGGDRVAIMMGNRIEHIVADHAVMMTGAAVVPIYLTFAKNQIAFIGEHCRPKVVIVENSQFADLWHGLDVVVITLGPPRHEELAWEKLMAEQNPPIAQKVSPEDVAVILYTSGTTGNPKGVPLTHRNVLYSTRSGTESDEVNDYVSRVGYLPLAHIAERMLSLYHPLWGGGHVYLVPDRSQLIAVMKAAQPLLFLGPPGRNCWPLC